MSRFFTGSDSDSETESGSSDNEQNELTTTKEDVKEMKFVYDSSSDEEEKRVVRSEKEKRWEEMESTIKTLKNHLKINDWVGISGSYDLLLKQLDKAKNVVKKHGIPKFWIKAMLTIQDAINNIDKNEIKNKGNSRALNTMRQKMRKTLKQYEAQVEAYNEDPLGDEAKKEKKGARKDSEDDEAEGSGEASKPKPKAKAKKSKADSSDDESSSSDGDDEDEGEDDDSEDWSDDSDDSDDEDDLNLDSKDIFKREFWVKRKDDGESSKQKKENRRKEKNERQPKVKEEKKEEPVEEKKDEKTYTPEVIMKKLKDVQSMRGKKGTDRQQVVADLTLLATKATSAVVMLKVKTTLAAALFDSVLNTVQYMPQNVWRQCHKCLIDMLDILKKNSDVRLSEDEEVAEAYDDDDEAVMSMESLLESREAKEKREEERRKRREEEMKEGGVQYVSGNLYSLVQRMHNEYRTSLQVLDPHTPDYVTRLRDEALLLDLVKAAQEYYTDVVKKPVFARQVVMLRLELLYYHYDPQIDELAKEEPFAKGFSANRKIFLDDVFGPEAIMKADKSLVCELATYLYKNGDDQEKTRALLCHVYYLSLHNKYTLARELILMSHVSDTINDADISERILFNRCTAQLGLCAFRVNETRQALHCLTELYQSNKVRELLAQGISMNRFNERDDEKEKRDRKRQYPYHMHINLDILEATHLLSAMFVEIPTLAQYGSENRRKAVSKHFRRLLDHHKNKAFNGPPENTRDCVMAATVAIQEGDWKKAFESIKKLKIWSMASYSEKLLDQVQMKVKEICLRTYLLSYGTQYRAVALEDMVEMFELDKDEVYKIISKMIVYKQVQGAWDQPSQCIVMHSCAPSRLQKAAIEYGDKANLFVEQNERLLEQRFGYFQGNENRRRWNNDNNNNNNNNFHNKNYNRDNYNKNNSNNGNNFSFSNFRRGDRYRN